MPVYPCENCNAPVDPTSEVFCRGCNSKTPYKCSRCAKVMGSGEIFQLERLKTKKPLLCIDCGEAEEVVKCGICKLSLVRTRGKQLSAMPGAKVYHVDCYNKQMKNVAMIEKILPFFAVVALCVGVGWGNVYFESIVAGLGAGVAAAVVSGGLLVFVKNFITPT